MLLSVPDQNELSNRLMQHENVNGNCNSAQFLVIEVIMIHMKIVIAFHVLYGTGSKIVFSTHLDKAKPMQTTKGIEKLLVCTLYL